jgi:hypothetical protein
MTNALRSGLLASFAVGVIADSADAKTPTIQQLRKLHRLAIRLHDEIAASQFRSVVEDDV